MRLWRNAFCWLLPQVSTQVPSAAWRFPLANMIKGVVSTQRKSDQAFCSICKQTAKHGLRGQWHWRAFEERWQTKTQAARREGTVWKQD